MPLPTKLRQTSIATPVGELSVVASRHGVRGVVWPGESCSESLLAGPSLSPTDPAVPLAECDPAEILRAAAAQLREYFAGVRTVFDLPLDPPGTPFQKSAWEILRTIPFGQTMTYGEQARRLGGANKARAVGAANGRNPLPIIVPCHRVIGADGSLTGFAAGVERKAWLLRHEAAIHSPADAPFADSSSGPRPGAVLQPTGSKSPRTQDRSKKLAVGP
jgi:methylated-DNA-[protein]-cysteine S-methyltransferase